LGTTSLYSGNASQARQQFSKAVDSYQQAVKLAPRNVPYQEDLARGDYALATAALRLADKQLANRYYGEALKIREARFKLAPNAMSLGKVSMTTLARCGQSTKAIEEAEKLRLALPKDNEALYAIACCYALCSTEQPRHAEKAVATLREAIAHGFKD